MSSKRKPPGKDPKAAAKLAKRDGKKQGEAQMRYIAIGVGGVVVTLYISMIAMFHGEGGIVYLSTAEPETLRDVFTSGNPWLVWCSDSVQPEGKEDVAQTHSVVTNAAPLLKRDAQVGILDCSAPLPSGKSTYEKASIDPKLHPTLFLAANGQKPLQIKPKHAKTAEELAAFVSEKARPVLRRPTNAEQLKANCLSRKWCGLVLTDGKPKGDMKAHLDQLVRRFRGVAFSAVDAKKYRLSTTPKVLTKFEPKPDVPTLLLLHKTKLKGKAVTLVKKYNDGDLDADGGAGDLIEQTLAIGTIDDKEKASGWTKLSAAPNLRYRKGASRLEEDSADDDEGDFELIEDIPSDDPGESSTDESAEADVEKKPKGAKAERIAAKRRAREEKAAAAAAAAQAAKEQQAEAQARARERARRQAMDREAERSADFIEEADPEDARGEDAADDDRYEGDDEADDDLIGDANDDDDDDDEGEGDSMEEDEEVVLLDDWDDDDEL